MFSVSRWTKLLCGIADEFLNSTLWTSFIMGCVWGLFSNTDWFMQSYAVWSLFSLYSSELLTYARGYEVGNEGHERQRMPELPTLWSQSEPRARPLIIWLRVFHIVRHIWPGREIAGASRKTVLSFKPHDEWHHSTIWMSGGFCNCIKQRLLFILMSLQSRYYNQIVQTFHYMWKSPLVMEFN